MALHRAPHKDRAKAICNEKPTTVQLLHIFTETLGLLGFIYSYHYM